MDDFIGSVVLMDNSGFYIVLGLSVLWSYLIYEMVGSWVMGVLCVPLFALCSFIAIYVLQSNGFFLSSRGSADVFLGSCIGSVLGIMATIFAVRLMSALGTSGLKTSRNKDS